MTEKNEDKPRVWGITTVLAILILLWGLYNIIFNRGQNELVVYCAHDAVYSEQILNGFTKKTGISIAVKFDTEATKSLGLVEMLKQERENPRCDVFWNNELLGMKALKKEGILKPYKGRNHERIPPKFKDPDNCWAGFGARMRVYILNSENADLTKDPGLILKDTPSQFAMAKPLYGTTLTHFSILWKMWGEEKIKTWFSDVREQGVQVLNGNSAVKGAVAAGGAVAGYTDTDDFFLAYDDKKPVQMQPVRLENGQTICIPNTVAVINGTDSPELAGLLVDYLLSEETEIELSKSAARQIPLGTVDEANLSDEVRQLREWAKDGYPLNELDDVYEKCLEWLKSEYSR